MWLARKRNVYTSRLFSAQAGPFDGQLQAPSLESKAKWMGQLKTATVYLFFHSSQLHE